MDLYLGFRCQRDGMEIQQVTLDGKRVSTERRPVADVGHRIETLLIHSSASDINAVSGHMFLVTAQVDGGHGVLRPVTASTAWSRQNAERASQQMSSSAHAALTNKFADVAAGHGFATQLHLRIFLHLKPHLPAQSDKFA